MNVRRGVTGLAASVVAVLVMLVATAVPASADYADIPTNTPLRLVNHGSLKCVQPVAGNGVPSWENGAPIQQLSCGNNVPNYWTAQYIGDISKGQCSWWEVWCDDNWEVYQFSSNFSGKCLDITGESTAEWAPMRQVTCTPGDQSTYWMVFEGDFDGTVIIKNFYSWLCLDVEGGSTGDRARLQQWSCTGEANNRAQNFYYSP
jgi:hypothetical protein